MRAGTVLRAGEAMWKEHLRQAVPEASPEGLRLTAANIHFVLRGDPHLPPDLDNLSDPVLSVVVNRLRWCGGGRGALCWLGLTKQTGDVAGCQIQVGQPPVAGELPGKVVFAAVYDGPLPRRATDDALPTWLL